MADTLLYVLTMPSSKIDHALAKAKDIQRHPKTDLGQFLAAAAT
jgi:hypothetical protein